MTEYYVKTDGIDSDNGFSIATAWQHPSYAAQQAQAGDTIYLIDGTWYGEHIVFANSGTEGNPIKITAYSGTPILDGNNATAEGIEISGHEWIKISSIKPINYTGSGIKATNNSSHITFENVIAGLTGFYGICIDGSHDCYIKNSTTYNCEMTGISVGQSYNIAIEGCHSYVYPNLGIYNDYGYSISYGSHNVTIKDCKAIATVGQPFAHGVAFTGPSDGDPPPHDCIVDNVTIEYAGAGLDARNSAYNVTWRNCSVLHDWEATQDWSNGVYMHGNVSNMSFENIVVRGYRTGFGFKEDASNIHLKNGIVYNCKNGILMFAPNTIVENSVAVNNSEYGAWINGGNTIKNSIVISNAQAGIRNDDGTAIITYCDVWNNMGYGDYLYVSPGTGCINEDPLFADPANHDFLLKSQYGRWDGSKWVNDAVTSPCIDAGDPADDYSNEPAPNGEIINMGAYGNTIYASKSSGIIPTGTIKGIVIDKDTGLPISEVKINANGYFTFTE